jgi:hypothetical protein
VPEPEGKLTTLVVLKGARPFNSFKLELDRRLKEAEKATPGAHGEDQDPEGEPSGS